MSVINEIGQGDFDSARVGTPALRGCAVTFAAMCAAMDFDPARVSPPALRGCAVTFAAMCAAIDFDPARVGTPALQFWNDTRAIANERHQ